MGRIMLLLAFTLLTAACGNAKFEQAPASTAGVPFEQELAPGLYRVSVTSGGSIGEMDARARMLKRCAEITISQGYTHFDFEDAVEDGTTYLFVIHLTNLPGPDSVSAEHIIETL